MSTLAAMSETGARQIIWENLPDDERRMSRPKFEKKADQKSKWAYRELKAFLTYTEKQGMDPTTIKGSYAGAMGMPQFIPSSFRHYAVDFDNDGKPNIYLSSVYGIGGSVITVEFQGGDKTDP